MASCSATEGKVMVSGLYTKENNHSMTMGATVNAVALDPIYARAGSGRRFMTGDDCLALTYVTYLILNYNFDLKFNVS